MEQTTEKRYGGFDQELLSQLDDVRDDGRCNMFDFNCVQRAALDMGKHHLAGWMLDNRQRYMKLLVQMGEWLDDGRPEIQPHDPEPPETMDDAITDPSQLKSFDDDAQMERGGKA